MGFSLPTGAQYVREYIPGFMLITTNSDASFAWSMASRSEVTPSLGSTMSSVVVTVICNSVARATGACTMANDASNNNADTIGKVRVIHLRRMTEPISSSSTNHLSVAHDLAPCSLTSARRHRRTRSPDGG